MSSWAQVVATRPWLWRRRFSWKRGEVEGGVVVKKKKGEDVTPGALCKEGRDGEKNFKSLGPVKLPEDPRFGKENERTSGRGGGERW